MAAEAVLGAAVTLGETFDGHPRNTVRRALVDGRGQVVLKTSGAGSRELAALRLLAGRSAPAPELLGWSDGLLVLEDLGSGPTLADRLLGRDPAAAAAALTGWAAALGRLAAATAGDGDRFADLLAETSPLGPPPVDTMAGELADAATALARELPRLGVTPSTAALDELRGLAALLDVPGAAALTPGDTCPDNTIEGPRGTALIDFEHAQHANVAWTAAYLRVPWPTCWCAWAMPEPVVAAALAAWSDAARILYVRADRFAADLDLAACGWVFVSTAWFLARAVEDDTVEQSRPMPTRRQMIQSRLALAARIGPPALAALAEQAHAATVRAWGDQPVRLAPAFR